MGTFTRMLRDGLRLAFFLRPRATPLDAGFATWFCVALLGLALDAAWHAAVVESPRSVNGYGVQTALAAGLLRLAASAALCALTRRRALFWTVATWLEAAALPVALVAGGLYVAARDSELPLHWIGWCLSLAWSLLIVLRLASFLQPARLSRAFGGAMFAFVLQAAPWVWLDAQMLWETNWSAQNNADDDLAEYREPGELAEPEATMYAQSELLSRALDGLAPQRPGTIDLFALAFGGDASEDVFRNEVEYVQQLLPQRFDATGHTLVLLNHPDTSASQPLATATNLERALRGLGRRMDPAEDVLFLYLTSHGSEEHELYVNQPPLALDQLTPKRLRSALDAAGIRWRVLVVSACYSGGYLDVLRDPQTLVMTASRADRASFGCGADAEITWFGRAFLAQALNATADFEQAFKHATRQIQTWEQKDGIEASHPQIDVGDRIGAQLERWRAEFTPGPALPFVPTQAATEVPGEETQDTAADAPR